MGNGQFQKALGVTILAGWIEPRKFDEAKALADLETKPADLLLYGFNSEEAARILFMSRNTFRSRIDSIKAKLGVETDFELVACRASEFRQILLSLRAS